MATASSSDDDEDGLTLEENDAGSDSDGGLQLEDNDEGSDSDGGLQLEENDEGSDSDGELQLEDNDEDDELALEDNDEYGGLALEDNDEDDGLALEDNDGGQQLENISDDAVEDISTDEYPFGFQTQGGSMFMGGMPTAMNGSGGKGMAYSGAEHGGSGATYGGSQGLSNSGEQLEGLNEALNALKTGQQGGQMGLGIDDPMTLLPPKAKLMLDEVHPNTVCFDNNLWQGNDGGNRERVLLDFRRAQGACSGRMVKTVEDRAAPSS